MKIKRSLALIMTVAGLLAFALPANAQSNRRGGNSHRGDMRRGDDGRRGDFRFNRGGSRVNFFFGGFGYPFYGYPYYGSPFYGYPYYGYAPYGYGYPVGASYSYDPRGIYQGRVVSGGGRNGSLAIQVQQQLSASGYYRGEIDGIIGEGTRRAIRNYERANNLPVDGRIDDQLLATMGLG